MKLEDIKKIGVVGAGTMGYGIAINFALWGYPTIMSDLSDEVLEQAMKKTKSTLALFVEEGLITSEWADNSMGRITTTTDLAKVATNSDFITEAILERAEDKRELFNQLDKLCPPHTIIVSNTSSLTLSEFASEVKRQDKIAITHYFVPPHIVPGVEVARGTGTSEETFNITYELLKRVRKIPVRVLKELPGCLLNRIQNAIRREAYHLWADGVATAEAIDLGVRTTFGFRMPHEGPMLHHDLSGVWRWSKEVRNALLTRQLGDDSRLSDEVAEKIKERLVEGKPWIIDPERFDEIREDMDRKYIQCLKQWYWSKER